MEILEKFKQNGYYTADLYHLLTKKTIVDTPQEIIPSEYQKEMKMSTEERLQTLNNMNISNLVKNKNKDSIEVLSFTPKLLVFQNFKPNDKIIAKFSVKNISSGPAFLNMVFKESSYFFVKPTGGQLLSRLAPGISVTFTVTFKPPTFEDYTHKVSFYTDVDRYNLPLIAVGPRPIFDFPDRITVPRTPLKVDSSILMNIHNTGILPAGFTLNVKPPFSVYPKSAYTSPRENIDVRVGFKTMSLGDTVGIINAIFETGENFRIKVVGTTYVVSVELEKQTVRFLDTFNTMARQQTFKITNKSPHMLTYMCMKNSCVFDDFEEKFKLANIFYDYKASASQKYRKLVHFDVVSSDEHDRVYTRIFFDELQSLVADESLQFQNTHFSITPLKGTLWPNKVTEITISFAPKEIGEFDVVAFLDIDGVLDRVPLKLVGSSLPPKIFLNVETLDMQKVYINKVYNYEIVALNKGQINGVIVYKEVPSLFGSRITCTPNLRGLTPGGKEVFIISFSNSNQGPYFEEIHFTIRDTKVLLKLYLKGEVIYPSLLFSKPCLDYGMISLGIPKTLKLEVINESVVDVNAYLKVSSDGPEISAITLDDYAVANKPKPNIPDWAREFNIEPSKIHLDPESRVSLRVTLTANLVRANQTSLELELEKSDSPPIALPIIFNAMVPEIERSPDIKLRACFIDFPYKGEVIIKANYYHGYFTIHEDNGEQQAMQVEFAIKEGMLTPNSTTCIPITVKIAVLGDQEYIVKINLFGVSVPVEICQITGCGVRPMVTITPASLHWGPVKVLTKSQKTLVLFNDSPVKVNFKTFMMNRDNKWQITPEEGTMDAESELELTVSLYLVDVNTYTNKAVIQMDNVRDIIVPLAATGVGTSIIVGELKDRIDLGMHYTKKPLSCKVVMENCGTRLHSLEWSEYYKAPKTKNVESSCFFDLQPRAFKMTAGEKFELTVTGFSNKVATIKEMWYLVGSVEGINKKELLLCCEVHADFVDPKIELSHNQMEFQYDFGPYSEYYKLTDIITIKNVSRLPLDMEISVRSPFAIIEKQSTYKISPEEENVCCCIYYNESDLNMEKMNKELGYEQSKTFVDCLTMKPVEPLRKGPLDFFQDINKIKAAFNLTYTVEERMEDQDIMKLQLIFDTTKHTSLKSKVYGDVLRIKFNGHKNKDCLKITGSVNFPNIIILTPKVDFQCILNGSVECKTIKIQNNTPLLACYKLQWRKCIITPMPSVTPKFHKMSAEDYMVSSRGNSTYSTSVDSPFKVPSGSLDENFASEKENDSITQDVLITQNGQENHEHINSDSEIPRVPSEHTNLQLLQKIMPMLDVTYESVFSWKYKFPRPSESYKTNVNDVLQLTPHRGLLKPGEVQYIHVIFKPTPNISVRAILDCEVLGGPTENVLLLGQSSDLIYKISTLKLNFKIRSFHENASESIIITNISRYSFGYKTYLNEPKFETSLEGIILNIAPAEKNLDSDQDCQVMVTVRPGVVGYFKRSFLLEIGHLPQTTIQVFGWGVIPQVYLTLSRSKSAEISPMLGYTAIASLTAEYLDAVNEFFLTLHKDVHNNSPQADKYSEDPDLYDWYICTSWDVYPTVMDIELAIERMLIINHFKMKPDLIHNKSGAIPGFYTAPYIVDFGVIITGTSVQCSADIINYGPIVTKVAFAKGTRLPSWLSVKLCGKLNPGESGPLEITFSPSSTEFTDLEENVETNFYLEVPNGVTIPIFMKALSAVPYLMSTVTRIDFGSVRCGNKVVCSIPLKNIGKPACIWFVTLRLKAAGPNPLQVLNSSGKYEPGDGGWLSISFKPTMEMIYEGMLVFKFHMNPNRMTIPIIGQGIVPHVHIIGPNVSFPPTLAWAETTEMYFGITNPCPFPVELIFIHNDKKWKEDEEIFHLLNIYYDRPEELLVPALEPGAGYPPEIISFYRNFKESVQKTMTEEAAIAAKTNVRNSSIVKSKGKSSPRAASKKKEEPAAATLPQKKTRTEAEVAAAELQKLKSNNCDPLKECMNVFEPSHTSIKVDREVKGIIIFTYGTPLEEGQCQEIAYSIGKKLDIPTVNIDQCMVDALCTSTHPSTLSILAALEEMYNVYKKYNRPDGVEEEQPVEDKRDQFELIKMKLEVVAQNKNSVTPRSKSIDKRRKRSPSASIASQSVLAAMGSTTMFQIDLLQDLYTDYFSRPMFNKGFVVDTLNSIVFKQPALTMTYVLKCKGHITNVHLIMCYSDVSKLAILNEDAEKKEAENVEAPVYDDDAIKEIVNSVEAMTASEYEDASPETKAIYVEHALMQRRQKFLEKTRKPPILHSTTETAKKEKKEKSDSKSILTLDASEAKKKGKKDDAKAKPPPEFVLMNNKYHDFHKNVYDSIINIANNWVFEEQDLGSPLVGFTGQVLSAAHKKPKKKSESHLQTSSVDAELHNRGFNIIFVMCHCLAYKNALLGLIAARPDFQLGSDEDESKDVLLETMQRREFSVLLPISYPVLSNEEPLNWRFFEEALIRKCECNQITDLNLLDDSTQDNVLHILSKWHCTCGKRVASSQTSTNDIPLPSDKETSEYFGESDSYLYPMPLRSVKTMTVSDGNRIVLGPGDLIRCKYTFNPTMEGYYKEKRFVEVFGWPESRVAVNVHAICDLPRLDNRPKKMFSSFLRRAVPGEIYKMAYLDDLKVFVFGPIFIGAQRIYEEFYSIELRNSSLMTANVIIEFLDDSRVFNVDTTAMTLDPGSRAKVTVSAAPEDVGVHKTVLLLGVKDNPEIIPISIECSGVVPHVEIMPQSKMIEYGKLLLYRRENDRFIVKNDSILHVMWKIRNPDEFQEDFIISKTWGIVPRHDNQVVPITYIACKVGFINQRPLIIDIYDGEGRGQPMLIDTLYLSAECYDVLVDCAYENPAENFLNYGNVKVNSTVTREMYLLNRGKYNIYYKFKRLKSFPEQSFLKTFELSQEHGVIPSNQRLVTVEFTCTPTTSINLTSIPAFSCSLLDGSKNQVVVAKFPIFLSIASFYNTFTLFPLGELNFHIIPVGSGVIRDVILNNTSKCPFSYEIVLPPEHLAELEAQPVAKVKDNKLKMPPMKCGNFLIINEDNLLAPGMSRTIQIQFNATEAKKFEETIKFVISDTYPGEAQGVPLRLVGTGALPSLDFWNIETTFREHLIVKNLSEYKVPESSPHCVFVEDSVTLYFFSVTINSSFTGAVDLYNNGLVASALTMKLNYQSNTNDTIFSLDKYKTHIEPLMHKTLGINFTPKALEEYRACLEIKLKLLDNQEKLFKICLIGEGVIPRINLVSPPLKLNRTAWLRFPVTCLGSISTKPILFKNITSTKSLVVAKISQQLTRDRPIFWLSASPQTQDAIVFNDCDDRDEYNFEIRLVLMPEMSATLLVNFNPLKKGRSNCEVNITIIDNPYEFFNVMCEAEAFSEEVIILDLEMLPMEVDVESYKTGSTSDHTGVSEVSKKKGKKTKELKKKKSSGLSSRQAESIGENDSLMKYLLDFGGCELGRLQKRTVVMVNNSEKVYKFLWQEAECITIKPSMGYIAPAEEKDLEILFFSALPVNFQKESLSCTLTAVTDENIGAGAMGASWDNRQMETLFERNKEISLNERYHTLTEEQVIPQSENLAHVINMVIMYSAVTEYTKYQCSLRDRLKIKDTFIYQTRKLDFTVENIGNVPMKISWHFEINQKFPARIDNLQVTPSRVEVAPELTVKEESSKEFIENDSIIDEGMPVFEELSKDQIVGYKIEEVIEDSSQITLFSGNEDRESVDTWFEIDLPFQIEPVTDYLQPNENHTFTITFAPIEAFFYKVVLKSSINNLDPYDQNVVCNITARSLIPYCHLDIEESDYLTSGLRKSTLKALPPNLTVLEFNVLGPSCYKKSFNVVNPTMEAYEFNFEMMMSDNPELMPVHCNLLKGFVEGGTSTEVTFTFSPTAPGVYESLWKFLIPVYNLAINLLVVGIVREPDVDFIPTILVISNSLVGFTTTNTVMLKNSENESLKFKFKGNSMNNEGGSTAVVIEPEKGILKARSETPIKIIYTPVQDGPLSFKIFCSITYMSKWLTLCVNALSYSIQPKVTYTMIGNEHTLNPDAITNIYLEQTASSHERTIPFTVKNDGSATFFYDWQYNCEGVKKYLVVSVEPKSGYLSPGSEVKCVLHFALKQVMVRAFPVTLSTSDGPEYQVLLNADIEKPLYYFSCKVVDFGKCLVNAPDNTYSKAILFVNNDKVPIIIDLKPLNVPEIVVDCPIKHSLGPNKKMKITIFFRPKQVKEYEFKLQFWVNSLCEEIVVLKGEGVPLLYDLYEGCQKSFNLGAVRVGDKIVRQIEVMNHSKVPIDATFIFKDMYPVIQDASDSEGTSTCLTPKNSLTKVTKSSAQSQGQESQSRVKMLRLYKDRKIQDQIEKDIVNAISSLKVIPSRCVIKPFRKVPLKIQFKPVGLISNLDVQLNMRVYNVERPLVKLSGSATGMHLQFSQNSMQFGRVRKRCCKILKVMLLNKGDYAARFWWQPLMSSEFVIAPMQGSVAARNNVTFTVTFRPFQLNPFIKIWASCNIEGYMPLELAMYASCLDIGVMQSKTLTMECPVRESVTEYVTVTNPSDDRWLVTSDMTDGPFETLKEFYIEPNSTFEIPLHYKPKNLGSHECQVLFSPLGEGALYVTLVGNALQPNPNDDILITANAKEPYTQELLVYNITEVPESYIVSTEIVKVIPDKFDGHYEINYPEIVKVWGEASAKCRWTFCCFEECDMQMKVMFINEDTREYQHYNVTVKVTSSQIVDALTFVTRARESLQKELVISNPLPVDAEFAIKCESLQVPSVLQINKNSEATLTMTYAPLVVGTTEDILEVTNNVAGTYIYKLTLKCTPAKKKTLEFTTPLGLCIPIRLRVHNKTDFKTDFECKVNHPSIIPIKDYTLNANEKGKFLVYFEPTELGEQYIKVSFDSLTAGEFIFNIKGTATPPKPLGPFLIKPGGSTQIRFKNIFNDERSFKIYTDRDEFSVKVSHETVKSKKEFKVTVSLSDQWVINRSDPPTGCLYIETAEDDEPRVTWTHFLQGAP